MNSAPALIVYITPVDKEVNQYYSRNLQAAGGTVQPDNKASLVKKVGEFDAEQKCWLSAREKTCLLRLNADVVGLFIDGWGQLILGQHGSLRGPMNVVSTNVTVEVPLAE